MGGLPKGGLARLNRYLTIPTVATIAIVATIARAATVANLATVATNGAHR